MNYFDQYNDYQPDSRRSSISFSDDFSGARRKQPRYRARKNNRGFGGAKGPVRNEIDSQVIFKEPREPPRRSPAQDRRRDLDFQNDVYHSGPSKVGGPYFDRRDMPRFVELEHSGTKAQWHWENYNKTCKSWLEKHKLAYYKSRCLALEFENQMLFKQINSLIEENGVFAAERGEMPSMRLPNIFGKQEKPQEKETKEGGVAQERTPAKKRMPEEKVKNEEAKKKKIEDDLKKEEEKKKEEGPTQPVGVERKESLDQLYGENSALIHKLETSVQLNFNRNCDTLKPELWLAVPLNPETVVD